MSSAVVGSGSLSPAVVGYGGGTSLFWWNVWLVVIHIVLILLVIFSILKLLRAAKASFNRQQPSVSGSEGLPLAVADKGVQCEIINLAGLTVEGLQAECRRTGLKSNGLRADLVARVDNELRRGAI